MIDDGYSNQLKKLVGNEVIVVDDGGHRFEGLVKAVNYQHLNIVLSEKGSGNLVIVRNVRYVKMIKGFKE